MFITFPTAVCRGIRGEAEPQGKESNKFDIDRLFEAVASRDVGQLDGLEHYLHRSMKKLSNTECELGASSPPADASGRS